MKRVFATVLCVLLIVLTACNTVPDKKSYSIFLSIDSDLDQLSEYETVVIDARFFSKGEIKRFKEQGHKVISYINIGSLESFRDYCDL